MRKEVIFELIKKKPGIAYNEMVRETGLSNGVISHYLIKLIENGEIEKEGEKRGKYFLKDISKKDRISIIILRNKTNNDVYRYISKNTTSEESVTANQISKKVKRSASTISVSLKILHKNNIIERVIMNENKKLSNDIGYRILNQKLSAARFLKYNL